MNRHKVLVVLLLFAPIFCSFSLFSKEEQVAKIHINTTKETNCGMPVHVYVKEIEKGEFFRNQYQDIAREAFLDSSTNNRQPLIPGKSYDLTIRRKQIEKPLGIFVLYTNPGENWRMIATGTNQMTITLGENEIQDIR